MYWNDTNSNNVVVSDLGMYNKHPHMTATIPEGYNCDPLQSTPILFLGSCDLDGPRIGDNQSWSSLLYNNLIAKYGPVPYIALGKMNAGFMSFPRRLLPFCEKYGPPKALYMVVPRPVAVEIPISTGQLVSISSRENFANFLCNNGRISEQDRDHLLVTSRYCRAMLANEKHQLYQFEQVSSFLKMICLYYNIELKWTINLGATATPYYAKYLATFLDNCPFMDSTFAGVGLAKDYAKDGSMGDLSQHQVCNVFLSSRPGKEEIEHILQTNLKLATVMTSDNHRGL